MVTKTLVLLDHEKRGLKSSHSDFRFKLISKVVAGQESNGYLAEVTTENAFY